MVNQIEELYLVEFMSTPQFWLFCVWNFLLCEWVKTECLLHIQFVFFSFLKLYCLKLFAFRVE
jgi:hypothetical protein